MMRCNNWLPCSVPCLGSMRLARNGMISKATSSEPRMVATTVVGSTRMNFPAVPGSAISGRNANTSVAVHPRIATTIWRVPASAAAVRS